MTLEELKLLEKTLSEARYFSKNIRAYLCEIEKQRILTNEEKNFLEDTNNIHVHSKHLKGLYKKNERKKDNFYKQ